ncbi:Uridylate kinase [subsurface metagenome]
MDGVYNADPEKDKTAKKFERISFDDVYRLELKVMDLTALTLCKENNLPIIVFNMNIKGNLKKIILNENVGTKICNSQS